MSAQDEFFAHLSDVSNDYWWKAPVMQEEHDHAYDNVIEDQVAVSDNNNPSRVAVRNTYSYESCGCPAPQPDSNEDFYAGYDTGE